MTIRSCLGVTPAPDDRAGLVADGHLRDDDPFAALVAAGLDELPTEFLSALYAVPVIVGDAGRDVGAYGVYHGAGVARPDVPAQIVIFRDTLERDFRDDPSRLASEVRRTLRHELAHHLGYGEAAVAELGL